MIILHFHKVDGVTSLGPSLRPAELLRLIGSDPTSYRGPHLPVAASRSTLAAYSEYSEVLAVIPKEALAALPKEQFPRPGVYRVPRIPEEIVPTINRRWTGLVFYLDTNRLNARGGLKNMCQLEQWRADGVIRLYWSQPAFQEAIQQSDGTINRDRFDKARNNMMSLSSVDTKEMQDTLDQIGRIIFSPTGPKNDNQRNDALIVFTANKYRAALITDDGASSSQRGGILGAATQLNETLGIEVMRDDDAVAKVKKAIANRDMTIRRRAARGERIPEWVGKD